MEFEYAHKDTSEGERETSTAQFNKTTFSEELELALKSANLREIPVSDRETLNFLTTLLSALRPTEILEIGTAVGISAAVMLSACPNAHITTIEKNEKFYAETLENLKKLDKIQRVTAIYGDAADILPTLENAYEFIFLDGAKAQYVKYLPQLKRLLKPGGTLLADDVLLFGYITGEKEIPKKRKMLVEHIKEYIFEVSNDSDFQTTVINLGNGLAMSVKK